MKNRGSDTNCVGDAPRYWRAVMLALTLFAATSGFAVGEQFMATNAQLAQMASAAYNDAGGAQGSETIL